MNLKFLTLRALVFNILAALFLQLILQPTVNLNPVYSFSIILILDILAFMFTFAVFGRDKAGQVVRLILSSAITAAFFVFVLMPAPALGVPANFDSVFVAVFIINVAALVTAYFLSREKK